VQTCNRKAGEAAQNRPQTSLSTVVRHGRWQGMSKTIKIYKKKNEKKKGPRDRNDRLERARQVFEHCGSSTNTQVHGSAAVSTCLDHCIKKGGETEKTGSRTRSSTRLVFRPVLLPPARLPSCIACKLHPAWPVGQSSFTDGRCGPT
jgi:hypothetical protein